MRCRAVPLAALLLATACETTEPSPRSDAGTRADAQPDVCEARYAVARRQPEVVLVLDRGCAMRARFDGSEASGPSDPAGRWGATIAAIEARLSRGGASWGLVLAPDDPTSCEAPVLRVAPGPGAREMIASELDREGTVDPFAVCSAGAAELPIEGALATLIDADPFTTERPLVLVVAAGAPSCGATGESLAAQVGSLGELGIEVAVIALSPDPALQAISTRYVEATSASALEDAFVEIVDARSDCVLELIGEGAPDPERLRVWIDDEELSADPDEGFSYDAGSGAIALNGAACEQLRAGEITRVRAAVGCDAPACVARDEACDGLDDDCDDVVDENCL
ncbi:hypothetical protein [Sandaracinus amylolyticus]|uniref:hypothetical protein n=1 Tax=Sandaracinus amylolyticus TaxID=927083 RepID=UPI001F44BF67|nr:hypothetical protein [Sandaracinus amylolyticus]UJR86753.1 Hypothetical protein I5071_88540 [Sandaracinus amylolyticus]